MDLTLQVDGELAAALKSAENKSFENKSAEYKSAAPDSGNAARLLSALKGANARLEPMAPPDAPPELSQFFSVTAPAGNQEALQRELLKISGVLAAYVSANPELP
jgi:hypothetical protein